MALLEDRYPDPDAMIKSFPPELVKVPKPGRKSPVVSSTSVVFQFVESLPSSLSAFSLATFVPELTVKGACPVGTLRPSAVAPAPVFVLVTLSAGPVVPEESAVVEPAEFGWPRMKLPPVAA
jgi:hypothetical protein